MSSRTAAVAQGARRLGTQSPPVAGVVAEALAPPSSVAFVSDIEVSGTEVSDIEFHDSEIALPVATLVAFGPFARTPRPVRPQSSPEFGSPNYQVN